MRIQLDDRWVCYGTGGRDVSPAQSERPVLLFIHGAGFNHSVWVMQTRYFARQGYSVVAPDLPGHGRSEGPHLTSIESMADWLIRLLDSQIEKTRPVLAIGHSMGSLVALAVAERLKHRTAGVALLGSSLPMSVGTPLLEAAAANDAAAYAMANTWSHSHTGRLGRGAQPGIVSFNADQRWLEDNADDVYHADLKACHDFPGVAVDAHLPVLVLVGEDDKMTPRKAGMSIADQAAGGRCVLIPGCGHSMMSEAPNEVLDALALFVHQLTHSEDQLS